MSAIPQAVLDDIREYGEAKVAELGWVGAAAHFGVSKTTVFRIIRPQYAEKMRRSSNAAKQRRRGVCVDCGGETRYNGHDVAVSERCADCARVKGAATIRARYQGEGSNQHKIYAALADGPKTYTQIRETLNGNRDLTGATLHRLVRIGRIVRIRRGVYALPE